jgi:hypothetical protein
LVCKVITADAGGFICQGCWLLELNPDADLIPRERRKPMSARMRVIEGVRELLEQQYLQSIGDRSKDEYGRLNDGERRAVLKAFLQKLTAGSESNQWAKVLHDIVQTDARCLSN